jgi:hypothetical protein
MNRCDRFCTCGAKWYEDSNKTVPGSSRKSKAVSYLIVNNNDWSNFYTGVTTPCRLATNNQVYVSWSV